jgi:hypothetical protein
MVIVSMWVRQNVSMVAGQSGSCGQALNRRDVNLAVQVIELSGSGSVRRGDTGRTWPQTQQARDIFAVIFAMIRKKGHEFDVSKSRLGTRSVEETKGTVGKSGSQQRVAEC